MNSTIAAQAWTWGQLGHCIALRDHVQEPPSQVHLTRPEVWASMAGPLVISLEVGRRKPAPEARGLVVASKRLAAEMLLLLLAAAQRLWEVAGLQFWAWWCCHWAAEEMCSTKYSCYSVCHKLHYNDERCLPWVRFFEKLISL